MFIQPNFHVPVEVQRRVLAGEWFIHGGIIRNATGQIMHHLKEMPRPDNISDAALQALQRARTRPGVTSVVTLAVVGSVAGGIYVRQQQLRTNHVVQNLNNAMTSYVEAIHENSMTIDVVDQLLETWQDVQKLKERRVKKMFESAGFELFLKTVTDYTEQFSLANTGQPSEIKTSTDNDVIDLAPYLQYQRKIIFSADAG